jgi:hypothetical protein
MAPLSRLPAVIVLPLALLLLFADAAFPSGRVFILTSTQTIDFRADNAPLNEVLRELGRRCDLDLKGIPIGPEPVSLDLTDATLEETLRKVLRGYNYVLMGPDSSGRGSLMILSKAQRTAYVPPAPPPAASLAVATRAQPAEGRQPGSTAPTPRVGGDAAAGTRPTAGPVFADTGGWGQRSTAHPSPSPQAGNSPVFATSSLASVTTQSGTTTTLSPLPQAQGTTQAGAASTSPLVPPSPPPMEGLKLPPAPPVVPGTTGTNQPGGGSLPPQVPSTVTSQTGPPDLRPPQVPF